MLIKTRGIALSYIKYRETSIIARIYTEEFGLQAYIVNGVRSKNARTKMAFFQPLSLLDLVVYHNKKKDIQRLSEIKFLENLHSIPLNIRKVAIAIFIAEFLGRLLREDEDNAVIFQFLHQAVINLERQERGNANFHLIFLLKLSHYIGIKPLSATSLAHEVNSPILGSQAKLDLLGRLMGADYHEEINMVHEDRNQLLDTILNFYRYHFDYIGECKSLPVLRAVF